MATKLLNNIVKIQDSLDDILDLTDEILHHTTYRELTYLDGTTTQWIDTGIKGGSSVKTELKIRASSNGTNWVAIFGARTGGANKCYMIYHKSSYTMLYGYNTQHIEGGSILVDVPTTVTINNNVCTVVNNNTGASYSLTASASTFDTDYSLFIGTINRDGSAQSDNRANFRFYGCKFWKSGELIGDLIPVIRISDNKVCVYDKVSKTFLENKGTGDFIAGSIK